MTLEDRWVTVPEAAALFGVPRSTLYRWIRHGEDLQMIDSQPSRSCTGRVMLFRLSEVANAIAARHAGKGTAKSQTSRMAQSAVRSHAEIR